MVCGGLKQEGIPATDKICGKVACDMAKCIRPSSLRRRESGIVRFGNDWKSR
ncbi:cell division protein FtsA [Neisseria gonorrhoeae]